jgi:hypothetical protein
MPAAELRDAERIAHVVLHALREGEKITLGRANPIERFFVHRQGARHGGISHFWDRMSSHVPMLGVATTPIPTISGIRRRA